MDIASIDFEELIDHLKSHDDAMKGTWSFLTDKYNSNDRPDYFEIATNVKKALKIINELYPSLLSNANKMWMLSDLY